MVYIWIAVTLPAFALALALGLAMFANWRQGAIVTRMLGLLFLSAGMFLGIALVAFMASMPHWTAPG